MSSEDDYDEVEEYDDEEENDSLFDVDTDEEISDLKCSIRTLYKALDFDQREELVYILDNIESIPWNWKKWIR
jgi:hypothetical protein